MTHRGVSKVVAVAAAGVLALLALAGPAPSTSAFDDVGGKEFFGPAVDWMQTQGLTTGVGGTEAEPSPFYEPFARVDRAQLATFLWRMAGSPEPRLADDGFTDTSDGAYYTKAVRWLRQQGYTTGVGGTPHTPGTTFEPHSPVDRAQAITLLWRYGGQPGPYGSHGFSDVNTGPPPTYFEDALRWAKAEGITTGYGGSDASPSDVFEPFIPLTRSEMAALVWRYAGFPARHETGNTREGAWTDADETTPTTRPTTTTTTRPPTTTTQPPTTTTQPPTTTTTQAPIPTEVAITSPTQDAPATVARGGSFEVVFQTNVGADFAIHLDVAEVASGETEPGPNSVTVWVDGDAVLGSYDLAVTVGTGADQATVTEHDAVMVVVPALYDPEISDLPADATTLFQHTGVHLGRDYTAGETFTIDLSDAEQGAVTYAGCASGDVQVSAGSGTASIAVDPGVSAVITYTAGAADHLDEAIAIDVVDCIDTGEGAIYEAVWVHAGTGTVVTDTFDVGSN